MKHFSGRKLQSVSTRNMELPTKANYLQFDVTFQATKNGKTKVILDHITDVVQSGQTLAIMGPSGAGKTTLLRVLTMEAFGGTSIGSVALNGQPMSANLFKQKCGLVSQEDYHWTFLTCKETLTFASELLQPNLTTEERNIEINQMLDRMGLISCQNTIVGNQFIRGLSGGQKRRLSVAVALMKKLDVIFLDEPTTGLDSASSAGVMVFLAEVTKRENLITIFTVHQPSTAIFNNFDRVLLLSKSRTAYSGSAQGVLAYLEAINNPLPNQMNPAEFLLEIVNSDFTDDATVFRILDSWDKVGKPTHDERVKSIASSIQVIHASNDVVPTSDKNLFSQTLVMLRRHFIMGYRDPMIYTGRMIAILMCTIFFAVVYIHARVRNQDQALQRFWFINWCIGVPTNLAVVGVYIYNIEFHAIKKEVKNGMLNPLSYVIANSLTQIPVMFLFALCALPIAGYGMISFQGAHFGQMWLIYAITMYVYEALSQLLAVQFSSPIIGMMQFMNMWFTSFIFCGIFLNITNIIWPLRVFSYILPFRYVFQLFAYQEFTGTTFHGAELCEYGAGDPSCLSGGYKCSSTVNKCYGYTGRQVLETIQSSFTVITPDDNFGSYIGIIIAIAVVFKIGFIVLMNIKSREISKIIPSEISLKTPSQETIVEK